VNILLINYEFPPIGAGASTATWHIGKELAQKGHNITVLTSCFKRKFGYHVEEGMTIFRCPALRKKYFESSLGEMFSFVFSALFFMPWMIWKHRIQGTIVFFSLPCGLLGLMGKLFFNVEYVISLRGGDVPGTEKRLNRLHKILQPLRRLILKRSQKVIANSEGLKNLAQNADPFEISIIPNGIDINYFFPRGYKKQNPHFEILFAGRLSEQKNLTFLFRQLSVFQGRKRKWKLHIAGDGPLKKQIQRDAVTLGISDHLHWYGWVEKKEILSLYQRADCFINPSLYEGMPNAVLEAMACGLPVIVSRVVGNTEVVIHGETGFLFELDDDESFQEALETISGEDALRIKMGQHARKRMENEFSWSVTAQAYASLFSKV